jgi:hypothetical protein
MSFEEEKEEIKKIVEKAKEGVIIDFTENVDLSSDPIAFIWWMHFKSALNCFANTSISYEDAYQRYKKLIYGGYLFLKKGMVSNDEKNSPILSENSNLSDIIDEIVDLLLKRKRKIQISLRL